MSNTYARQRQIEGTTADWAAHDLILGDGELALERHSDGSVRAKVGDGSLPFSGAPYLTTSAAALHYKGNADPTDPPPAGAAPGDVYTASPGGVVDASWGPPAAGMTVNEGDFLILDEDGDWNVQAGGIDASSFVTKPELGAPGGSALVGFIQAGTGAVARNSQDKGRERLSVADFGTVGDGVADDTAKIQAAIDALANDGELVFNPGTYLITAPLIFASRRNIRLSGFGALVKATTKVKSFFSFTASQRVVIEGFEFDAGKTSLPVFVAGDYAGGFMNCPISWAGNSSFLTVRNCRFTNLYTAHIDAYSSSFVEVDNCWFQSPVQTQTQWLQFCEFTSVGGHIRVTNNEFSAAVSTNAGVNPCAVVISGSPGSSYIANNKADYCGRDNTGSHRLGVFDYYGDAKNAVVENNVATNVMGQFMRFSAIKNGIIRRNRAVWNLYSELAYSGITVESVVAFDPGQVGCQDIIVEDNILEDPFARLAFGIGVLSYDWGAPATNVKVNRNTFIGVKLSVLFSIPFAFLEIEGNTMRGGAQGTIISQMVTPPMTSIKGTEAASFIDELSIRNNVHVDSTGLNGGGITLGLNKTPAFSGSFGTFVIEGNRFRCTAPSAGQGINLTGYPASAAGKAHIRNNQLMNYGIGAYIRGVQEVRVENNTFRLMSSNEIIVQDHVFTRQRGNSFSTGPMSGIITMTGAGQGVVTIEARTGDTVRLTRLSHAPTLADSGHVSAPVASIINKTSFAIYTSNPADRGQILWDIDH